jgi:hypothetical protein
VMPSNCQKTFLLARNWIGSFVLLADQAYVR